MRRRVCTAALGVHLSAAFCWGGNISILRFERPSYEVAAGETTLTATVLYELTSGIVGDNYFDLDVTIGGVHEPSSISITEAARSDPYLYDGALAGAGVFNDPSDEFALFLDGTRLSANQGAYDPARDMDLASGVYEYVDVTFSFNGPVGTVFDLTFSNVGLHDADLVQRPLTVAHSTIVIIPEPATAAILLLGGGFALLPRRRIRA